MNNSTAPSLHEEELRELRARAYGPHPDIQDDPEALARLAELEGELRDLAAPPSIPAAAPEPAVGEAAVPGIATATLVTPDSGAKPRRPLRQRVLSTRSGRTWLAVGSVIVVVAFAYAITLYLAPNPEVTLQPTGVEAESATLAAVSYAPLAEVDRSTLRGYETYRGLQPWVAENAQGSRCLMGIEGGTLHGIRCAPPGAELMIDFGAFPDDYTATYMRELTDGSVIRLVLRGDTVEAYLFPAPRSD